MLPSNRQGTRKGPAILAVDILTEFYARYSGLPSRFRNGPRPGSKPVVSWPAGPLPGAISVGTRPMIAVPLADFMRSVAASVGSDVQPRCNERGHELPMIAFPCADDCSSLQVGFEMGVAENGWGYGWSASGCGDGGRCCGAGSAGVAAHLPLSIWSMRRGA